MDRDKLVSFLSDYNTPHAEEDSFINRFLELLNNKSCYERTHLPGHITGSSWIVDPGKSKALLVHHAKLNKWMQPGGHADGDENILRVALKEAEEETGLQRLKIISGAPFDIDIHVIPQRKDFPEHFHFDVRFLLEADPDDLIQVSEESHDVKWIDLTELEQYTQDRSVLRMKDKLL